MAFTIALYVLYKYIYMPTNADHQHCQIEFEVFAIAKLRSIRQVSLPRQFYDDTHNQLHSNSTHCSWHNENSRRENWVEWFLMEIIFFFFVHMISFDCAIWMRLDAHSKWNWCQVAYDTVVAWPYLFNSSMQRHIETHWDRETNNNTQYLYIVLVDAINDFVTEPGYIWIFSFPL